MSKYWLRDSHTVQRDLPNFDKIKLALNRFMDGSAEIDKTWRILFLIEINAIVQCRFYYYNTVLYITIKINFVKWL